MSLNFNTIFTDYIKHDIVPSDLDNSLWIYIWGSTMPVRSKFSWIQLSIFANSSPSNKCACQTLIKLQYQNLSNFLHIAVTSGLVLVLPTCYRHISILRTNEILNYYYFIAFTAINIASKFLFVDEHTLFISYTEFICKILFC